MKFTVLKKNIHEALGVISRAVNPRAALPILSNIFIKVEKGRVKLTATDLKVSISAWVGAKVEEEGEITVPARLLIEFVNQILSEKLEFELIESQLKVSTDKSQANFSCMSAKEFPITESFDEGTKISLNSQVAVKSISEVQFAAAPDESRPVLAGIYCKLTSDKLILACTDGYRMAEQKLDIKLDISDPIFAIIPAKVFSDVVKSFTSRSDTIDLVINTEKNTVSILGEDLEAQIRTIEGEYPDYQAVVPSEFNTEVRISRSEILNGIKLASIFSRDSGNSIKIIISENGEMEIRSQPSETGSNFIKLEAEVEGDEIEIAFNAKYLIDFLSIIDADELIFRTMDPLKPGLFNVLDNSNYFFLAMPMKANW